MISTFDVLEYEIIELGVDVHPVFSEQDFEVICDVLSPQIDSLHCMVQFVAIVNGNHLGYPLSTLHHQPVLLSKGIQRQYPLGSEEYWREIVVFKQQRT